MTFQSWKVAKIVITEENLIELLQWGHDFSVMESGFIPERTELALVASMGP